ncbi:negative regulation of gluconeogenesis [Pseudohyphozyma bogoriensis]|nr:negative regulation of gluconeogenesis [Pseudohyphozyma bogoriensis]
MSASTLNPDHLLLLEQATLKAIDALRRIQKTTQKTFEHNYAAFQKDLDSLVNQSMVANASDAPLSDASQAEMLKSVDGMLSRMRGLKRKLSDLSTQSSAATHVATTRMNHLATLPESMDAPAYGTWARHRLDHQLADYFLRSSPPLKRTAMELAKEEGIQELVDFELWEELAKAESGLRAHRLEEVLAWVGENRSALRKMKSPLEFTIHLQAYIELCRARSFAPAIAYAKKNLSSTAVLDTGVAGSVSQEQELNRAMALLAFGPDTTCSIYQELYAPNRWDSLLTLFRSTFLALHSLPSLPLLHFSLQAGIASLKTPICCPLPTTDIIMSSSSTPTGRTEGRPSKECPVCSSPLKNLAPEVPYSHHVNSLIVCGISGKVVEGGGGDGGQLVALVSKKSGEGRIYSKAALEAQQVQHPQNKLIDPETKEQFQWDQVKKVFIS